MKFHKRWLSFCMIPLLLVSGCSKLSIPTNANTAFENFTRCLFQQEVATNTINLHYSLQEPEKYGITDTPITFGSFDFEPSIALATIENLDNALHKFSYKTLSEKNQLTFDVLSYYFDNMKEHIDYYYYDEPLSPITGIHTQLPVLLAEYTFTCRKDVETYLSLLETLPDYFESLIRFEQKKTEQGLFMADVLADEVIAQCHAFVNMGNENYLLSTFEDRIYELKEISSADATEFIDRNQKAISNIVLPAYENLATGLAKLKGNNSPLQGLCHLPLGKEYYAHLAATESGSSRNIEETKTLIQNQLTRDLLDMQQIIKNYPDMLKQTNAVSQSPDAILKTLENNITSSFPVPASVDVEVKYVPTALESYLSPAFYLIPSIDNYLENVIYINQSYSMDDVNLFTTLAHEGYPGHLYQTTYYAATNPDPIRTLVNFTGYVEGWATYAEMCSYYISSLEKPYATLLQKNNSMVLGLYAYADIGIHYDGWTVQDTLEFFSSYGIDDQTTIEEIYQLIVGDPANYIAYHVGYLEVLELKKEMMRARGDAFSQKEFHQQLLTVGPAPFEVITKHLIH